MTSATELGQSYEYMHVVLVRNRNPSEEISECILWLNIINLVKEWKELGEKYKIIIYLSTWSNIVKLHNTALTCYNRIRHCVLTIFYINTVKCPKHILPGETFKSINNQNTISSCDLFL